GEFFTAHVLQQISRRPGFERAPQVSRARKRSNDDYARPCPPPLQFRSHVEAAHVRHFNVGDEDVGLVREHGFERFFAVARLPHDRNIALDFQQRGQRAQHHPLIFGQNHADSLAAVFGVFPAAFSGAFFAAFFTALFKWRVQLRLPSPCATTSFVGSVIVSLVPARVSRSSVPPSISTRSRMPRNPFPSPLELPRPSSWISSRQLPFSCS